MIVLGGVAIWQGQRIGALTRRVADLERRLSAAAAATLWTPPAPAVATQPVAPAPVPEPANAPVEELEPLLLDRPLPPDDREPLLLDTPLPPEEQEPLLLDTPLPEPSNDVTAPPPIAARAEPTRIFDRLTRTRAKPDRKFEEWLAQNGLAWLAAGALALGAIFLVSYAAQQNWFTPQVRLICALILGIGLIGASEWARRVSIAKPPGHPLVAALLAGAGVVALYATAWAAHGLYGFIGYGSAAALLTVCALVLIGLSFLHGQAIGVLAIIAAMLAPPLADSALWPSAALTLYVAAVGAAGFGLAALRRWGWVAAATLLGLYGWFWTAFFAEEMRRALALASFASFGAVALALRAPLADTTDKGLSWRRVHALGPSIAVAVSSIFLVYIWDVAAVAPAGRVILGPALISVFHVALAAYAVRGRVAHPAALIATIVALVLGVGMYMQGRFYAGPFGIEFYVATLSAAAAIIICTLGARPHRESRVITTAAGAIGAALLTALAASSRPGWSGVDVFAPLFGGAMLLFAAAWYASRDTDTERTQRVIDFWAGAAAALVMLGLESALPAETRVAQAGAALLFASAYAWRNWRVLRYAALVAAALTIAHALSPELIGATLMGQIPLWGVLTILAVAAALLFGAAYFAATEPRSVHAEALTGSGIIVVLIGVFLALRYIAAGGAGVPFDAFTEASLRALTLIAAGHIAQQRPGQDLSVIGKWRGHVLMGLGLGYVLLYPAYAINPWWGADPARVIGPPFLDTLTLAFAAPAALSLAASWRLYTHQRIAARIYAIVGGVLALFWAVLEVRRLAHNDAMATAPVGLLEGAAYALIFLAAAVAVAVTARLRTAKHADGPFTQDLMRAMRACAWGGIVLSALILLVARHPWWGGQDAAATNALQTGLAVLAQLVAVALALVLGRALSTAREPSPARFAAASAAVLFAWSFGHAATRWLYHLGGMDNGGALIGLEGFAHAIWPLAFVLAGAAITERTPGRDTVRAYLYDLQAIWSAAVWPALAYAALGLWFQFNPWWGAIPAAVTTPLAAVTGLVALVLTAWLSAAARNVPFVRAPEWFDRAATLACVIHLLVAVTLAARWLQHGAAMSTASASDIELWVYSAVWALFGAVTFAVGLRRDNAVVRWSGLTILIATTIYVYFLTFTRLTGVIRALTAIGLAFVLFVVAWVARTYRPPKSDITDVTPSARREKRYGRRQRL
jgi:uncharacterized membrane protein